MDGNPAVSCRQERLTTWFLKTYQQKKGDQLDAAQGGERKKKTGRNRKNDPACGDGPADLPDPDGPMPKKSFDRDIGDGAEQPIKRHKPLKKKKGSKQTKSEGKTGSSNPYYNGEYAIM